MNLYGQICDTKPAVLRQIYRNLTGDHTALTNEQEKEIHQRIVECLEGEDNTLIFDLRVNSGRVEDYLPFLEEVKKHIQSQVETAVSDRRHDSVDHGQVVTHMATALNAASLYKEVVKKCPEHVKIPSLQWLRWQFWPRHAGHASSNRYSGKIKIRYMIMGRQFRATHPDVHYASAIWRYAREFSVRPKAISCICRKIYFADADGKQVNDAMNKHLPSPWVKNNMGAIFSVSSIGEEYEVSYSM